MKVGFHKGDLEDFTGFYDVDDKDVVKEVAQSFADDNHQIDEESDMNFAVYVEDEIGCIHEVKFFTEYDPRFEVESASKVN